MREKTLNGFCPSCCRAVEDFAPGPRARSRARCPECSALERHRLLAFLFDAFGPEMARARTSLEVGPAGSVKAMLATAVSGRNIGIDFDPTADGRDVDVIADLCATPFASDSIDVAVCFHVLEHIPDDRAAMRELARILSPDGLAFLQVPWRPRQPTDEDPHASPEERVRRFGQADHVRRYGTDFEERLRLAGLQSLRVWPRDIVPEELATVMSIPNDAPIWIVAKSRRSGLFERREAALADLRRRLSPRLIEGWKASLAAEQSADDARIEQLEQDARLAAEEAAHWERAYRQLRDRLPIRIAAAVRDFVRSKR